MGSTLVRLLSNVSVFVVWTQSVMCVVCISKRNVANWLGLPSWWSAEKKSGSVDYWMVQWGHIKFKPVIHSLHLSKFCRYSIPLIVGGMCLGFVLLRITYRTRTNPFSLARQVLLMHIVRHRRQAPPVQAGTRQIPVMNGCATAIGQTAWQRDHHRQASDTLLCLTSIEVLSILVKVKFVRVKVI